MPVGFDVTNQKASPALYASSFATRPAPAFVGRLFVDTDTPSTGIYRDTGTVWLSISGGSSETQSLNDVCVIGNTTTALGIFIYGDSAMGTYDGGVLNVATAGYVLSIGVPNGGYRSIYTDADCLISGMNLGNGSGAPGGSKIENTILGNLSMYNNDLGINNTGIGYYSLAEVTNGNDNTACGSRALRFNEEGNKNTAIGSLSLFNNLDGFQNTACGMAALYANVDGNNNTAVGYQSLYLNQDGGGNTSIGYGALYQNVDGYNNVAIGYGAGNSYDGQANTFLGAQTLLNSTSDSYNVIIGYMALAPLGDNQFVVGSATYNAGAVTNEVNASTRVWNVTINGVNRKILLA